MEEGVNALEKENVTAWIDLESPASGAALFSSLESSCASSPYRIPKRLRRRLVLGSKTPSTVEEIEARLRDADLRRQQYHEKLASKARSKARSPSHSSLEEEDLGQRLEAKLQAAERKRLSMLAKARKRLARLDELRQAAKAEMELHHEEQRLELGTKVQSRAQKAEENRLLILKAFKQRRATLNERSSISLYRRITRENKYKECVSAAIYQKRMAAETKRLGFVEAEKKKVHARALQVRRVANSVNKQRELDIRMRKEHLEDRLMRARRQRTEYLKYRGRQNNHVQLNRLQKHAELLSWKLARCWRKFVRMRRTTLSLTEAYDVLKIEEISVKSMPFEQLAVLIESSATLKTVKALLDRLEQCFRVYRVTANTGSQTNMANMGHQSSLDNIDHLLKRVSSPKKKTSLRSRERNREGSISEAAKNALQMSRYPVRVVLCAYMILVHPDAVFSGQGVREKALAQCAEEFVKQFELLVKIILEGPIQSADDECDFSLPNRLTFRSQLVAFDNAWCSYLNCFVVWKVKDARLLEDDMVRAACQLELSMIQTCKLTSDGDNVSLTHDMKAIRKQVANDQRLLREKVQHLSGDVGIERMERALSETRTKYFVAKENGTSTGFPTMDFIPSPSAGPLSSSDDLKIEVNVENPRHIVRSLFRDDDAIAKHKGFSNEPVGPVPELVTENECLVNEFLHEQYHIFSCWIANDKQKDSVKTRIRETMEKAFWDGIEESLKQDKPNYDGVVQLMVEVQDELCKVAPESWKQQINDITDVDILSQVLKSGNLDVFYLGRTLEFALVTLQKLSSLSKEGERKASHQKFLKELAEICQSGDESKNSCVVAMIKGLRFVLEQIQVLNQEISEARIKLLKPILEGPDGVEYLRNCFSYRYGPVTGARKYLPLTVQWMSSVSIRKDEEWVEHKNSLLALEACDAPSQACLPSTTLRTGGGMGVTISAAEVSSGRELAECKGGKVDLLVRLGLLKLVSRVSGLTKEELPETFGLNLNRMRSVQAHIQQIIVMIISILVCRQTIMSERLTTSVCEMEGVIAKCVERLSDILNRVQDAGIDDITEAISTFDGEDGGRVQSRRLIMERMIGKCLQSGDAVFEKVSRAVYVAMRGVLLGGTGLNGKRLAELALRPVGASALTKEVMKAGQILVAAATVSVAVHEPWYALLC